MRAQIVAATQSWVDGGNDRSRSLHCFTGSVDSNKVSGLPGRRRPCPELPRRPPTGPTFTNSSR
jgi:hypothetical protein